jgi:kumamolisin
MVVLRPRAEAVPPDLTGTDVRAHAYTTRAELAIAHGADPSAIARVEHFAAEHGLTTRADPAARTVDVTGTVGALNAAFGVELRTVRTGSSTHRGRTGVVYVPSELAGDIEAVLGLDDRPQVRRHSRRLAAGTFGGYAPAAIAAMYDFPTMVTGNGQCIGIAEFGGGFVTADLDAFCDAQGLPRVQVEVVGVGGGANRPGVDEGDDIEVMLDIEVAHSIAPDADIVVYFAANTTNAFTAAIKAAVHDDAHRPSALSISWGGPEESWTKQTVTALESALADAARVGMTVVAASGDDGSRNYVGDGAVHVNYPASSPAVLGCGGTHITVQHDAITREVVWNDGDEGGGTGGGVSARFALPEFQNGAGVPVHASSGQPGRGVPDVAADASPASGYAVRENGGAVEVIGGTSAVAPMMAAFVALANEHLGSPVGFLNAALYARRAQFGDIDTGDNDTTGELPGYESAKGWDACTGLGSPHAAALMKSL